MIKNSEYIDKIIELLEQSFYGEITIHAANGEIARLEVKESIKIQE